MMESKRKISRETYIVGGLAIFIVVSGLIAYAVIVMSQEPQTLDEQMWFRITSDESGGSPLNSTLCLISIASLDGSFLENVLYVNDGEWQSTSTAFEIGHVIYFAMNFYENDLYYGGTYRIGRGPVSVDVGNYEIEFISYWELPDY